MCDGWAAANGSVDNGATGMLVNCCSCWSWSGSTGQSDICHHIIKRLQMELPHTANEFCQLPINFTVPVPPTAFLTPTPSTDVSSATPPLLLLLLLLLLLAMMIVMMMATPLVATPVVATPLLHCFALPAAVQQGTAG
jgi:hypothetical protein